MAGLSLRAKVLLVLVPLAVAPAAGAVAWLSDQNRAAVAESERTLQMALLGEARERAHDEIEGALVDARAVAAALAESAILPKEAGSPLPQLQAVLATRRALDAVRFEVPELGTSGVLNKEEVDPARVPRSTPELRAAADRDGWAFAPVSEGRAVLVVPIVPTAAIKDAKKGYVTAGVHMDQFRKALADTVSSHAEEGAMNIVVADRDLRAVACAGIACDMGQDLSTLPVWQLAKTSTRGSSHAGLARVFEAEGVPMFGTEAGLPGTGWSVAVWRPTAVAFRASSEFARRAAIAGAAVLLLAALAGVWFSRVLTRPILRLVDQVKLVGQRRWSEIRATTGRTDELGLLEGAIDGMAKSLEAGEAEIQRETKLRGDLSRFMNKDLVDAIVRRRAQPRARRQAHADHSALRGRRRLHARSPRAARRSRSSRCSTSSSACSPRSSSGTAAPSTSSSATASWPCGAPPWRSPITPTRALAAAEDMMHFLEVERAGSSGARSTTSRSASGSASTRARRSSATSGPTNAWNTPSSVTS
jgi:adenylate cyclase